MIVFVVLLVFVSLFLATVMQKKLIVTNTVNYISFDWLIPKAVLLIIICDMGVLPSEGWREAWQPSHKVQPEAFSNNN